MESELISIRDNAKVFQKIQQHYGSVWRFINQFSIRDKLGYLIIDKDKEDYLFNCFVKQDGQFKLSRVRLAICCEFFKNIGIDEFKPDVHAIRFFRRIGVAKSERRKDIRRIGITIAKTLEKPRRYVDSSIWRLCAEDEGEICTAQRPKCHLCKLKIDPPHFASGIPIDHNQGRLLEANKGNCLTNG